MNQVQSNIVIGEFNLYNPLVSLIIAEQNGSKTSVSLQIQLDQKCLITHVIMACVEKERFPKNLQFQYSESVDQFESRQISKQCKNLDSLNFTVLYITKKFRLVFNLEEKSIQVIQYQDINDNKEFEEVFKQTVNKITVFGYHLYTTPPSNQMVCILNASHFLKKYQQEISAADADILLGLCLISSRRFLQAAEIFKKVAQLYALKALQQDFDGAEQLILMAASLQILVADSINQPSMMNEKLQSLITCVRYFNKNIDIRLNQDMYDCVLKIHNDLIKIICKILPSKIPFEALKLAHLRCLEFLIEQLGCGLGDQIIGLIRMLGKNFGQCSQYLSTMHLKLLFDLLQVIQFASTQLKTQIWIELIESELFQPYDQDVKLFYIKLAEYTIELTGGEIPLSLHFIFQMTHSQDNYYSKIWQYIIDYSIKFQTSKKIQKILHSSQNCLNEIIGFQSIQLENQIQFNLIKRILILSKNCLIVLNSDQIQDKQQFSMQTFQNMLTLHVRESFLLRKIYGGEQVINLNQLIHPMRQLLQETVSKKINLELFSLVIDNFVQLQIYQNEDHILSDLLMPYITNLIEYCRDSTPQLDHLKLIQIMLKNLKHFSNASLQCLLEDFLSVFCGCIPHSIYDDTFHIFDQLIEFTIVKLDTDLIERSILALIDQYTVKGKAQKFSKQFLIKKLCTQPLHLLNLIDICLYKNEEPQLKKDGKLFAQEYEIFVEKLSVVQETLVEIPQDLQKLILQQLIVSDRMMVSLTNLLQSQNSKIRWKGLIIIKIYHEVFVKQQLFSQKNTNIQLQDLIENTQSINDKRQNPWTNEHLQFMQKFLKLLQETLQDPKDEKSQLQSLQMVEQIFSSLLYHSDVDSQVSFCDQSQSQDQNSSEMLLKMILNIWDYVIDFTDSYWNNISSIVYSIIQSWVKFQDNFDEPNLLIFINKMIHWVSLSLCKVDQNTIINTLQICGSFLGLRASQFMIQNPDQSHKYFKRYQKLIPLNFWEPICKLQHHKNQNIRMMSICIIQCCSPSQISQTWFIQRCNQLSHEDAIMGQNKFQISQSMLGNSYPPSVQEYPLCETVISQHESLNSEYPNSQWLLTIDTEHLLYILGTLFEESRTPTSFLKDELHNLVLNEQMEQQTTSFKEEKKQGITKVPFLDDDHLDFDELGIIEVDDEEWNEYDDLKKVPILKGKMKNISPQLFKKEDLQISRKWSGKQQGDNTIFNIDTNSKTDDLKFLRPHNPLFRPLTPPIGSNNNPQLLNNMELFQNYAIQNPDQFQKLIDEIKHQQVSSVEQLEQQKESQKRVEQFEQFQKVQRPQSRIQRPQSTGLTSTDNLRQLPSSYGPSDYIEQDIFFQKRKVDELEYDPTFNQQKTTHEDNPNDKKKETKIKKKKTENHNSISSQLTFKDIKKLWDLSLNKNKVKSEQIQIKQQQLQYQRPKTSNQVSKKKS